MEVQQVPSHFRFPSGDSQYLAVIKHSPAKLSELYSLSFENDYDDFDYYQLAALNGGKHGQIWLFRYRNSPDPGTEILVDAAVNPDIVLDELLAAMHLSADDLSWVYNEQ